MYNSMKLQIKALAQNESFARATVAAFATMLNPTIDDIGDIKTIVSEAVTNAIVHGYQSDNNRIVTIEAELDKKAIIIRVKDDGVGISNIDKCLEDNYTTDTNGERSGLGFTIIKALSDGLVVESTLGQGTTVTITKQIA